MSSLDLSILRLEFSYTLYQALNKFAAFCFLKIVGLKILYPFFNDKKMMSVHYHWKSQSSKTGHPPSFQHVETSAVMSLKGPCGFLSCSCAAGGCRFLLVFWVLPHQATPHPASP